MHNTILFPLFFCSFCCNSIVICELSKNRKVSVRSWNGRVVVDIREFYYKDGKEMPGKKAGTARPRSGPSVIETVKVNHQRNGEWVNERAAQDYEKMVEEREEQTHQASSSSVAVNEHDVVLKVLGERRGHRRAVGRVLKGTSRSHSSTTRLRDQHSTSKSTEATNALKSKMETYMHQMNEFITLLTSNLQSVMSGIQLPTPPPPPPPPLSPMHEEELDSSKRRRLFI
ncbi:Transcriptional coactivator [Abeliophyllum distichum]|uniref:Transcriptional coactivator n=1 Tax=Abeliophyllum distichum TaxID=126358 RepID=A0ABD1VZF4_9LAMI